MSQAELAERTGRAKKTINEIIKGKAPLTPDTALQLERVFGVPASFWNNREQLYRENLALRAERDSLEGQVDWLNQFPVGAMASQGWITLFDDPVELLREVLNFFGIASPTQWKATVPAAAFRQSQVFESDPYAISAWLRQGEIEAQEIDSDPYRADKFIEALGSVRALTREDPEVFQPQTVRLCAEAGVAVAFVPELPKVRASGAARWITPNKALIQVNLRFKSDDQLWFSLFHEAGHILRHGKREVFVDDGGEHDDKEEDANQFAANFLIPPRDYREFTARTRHYSKAEIVDFAEQLGIAPGIVVGRLQHDGELPPANCNDLKRSFQWIKS